jgi:FMNH2-dependent dimethyl sulfone monooxygenase
MIVSRDNNQEATTYLQAILAAEDVDGFVGRSSDSQAWLGHRREQRILGGDIQLIGSPERIVDYLLRLRAAGVDTAARFLPVLPRT